eukprot:TRINITY_DN7109_c0_g1_i1.p1 TRINITY_DN7109_c0_g1~~TRINITY_DN7109_c0_g1_i1.p1  ORF type:complete len:346 (+),score=72.68 TRINITY_DN7109_c0_g1_i1:351-1388(+)
MSAALATSTGKSALSMALSIASQGLAEANGQKAIKTQLADYTSMVRHHEEYLQALQGMEEYVKGLPHCTLQEAMKQILERGPKPQDSQSEECRIDLNPFVDQEILSTCTKDNFVQKLNEARETEFNKQLKVHQEKLNASIQHFFAINIVMHGVTLYQLRLASKRLQLLLSESETAAGQLGELDRRLEEIQGTLTLAWQQNTASFRLCEKTHWELCMIHDRLAGIAMGLTESVKKAEFAQKESGVTFLAKSIELCVSLAQLRSLDFSLLNKWTKALMGVDTLARGANAAWAGYNWHTASRLCAVLEENLHTAREVQNKHSHAWATLRTITRLLKPSAIVTEGVPQP